MALLTAKFTKYGLIDVDASPADRVFVADVHEDTQATIRDVIQNDADPDGATYFSGFQSEVALATPDLAGLSQGETWMTGFEDVELVAITPDHFIQWYNPGRLVVREQHAVGETNLAESMAMLTQMGGDNTTHDVYATRNALFHLAPTSGGWDDSDNDGVPDGYGLSQNVKSQAFASNVYEFFVDTASGSTGYRGVQIPFPLDGVTVTLSVEFTQLHDDGTNKLRIEAVDSDGSTVQTSAETTVSSTGRKSVEFTTPTAGGSGATYYLNIFPARVESATAETAKVKVKNPCLRADGSSTFVER